MFLWLDTTRLARTGSPSSGKTVLIKNLCPHTLTVKIKSMFLHLYTIPGQVCFRSFKHKKTSLFLTVEKTSSFSEISTGRSRKFKQDATPATSERYKKPKTSVQPCILHFLLYLSNLSNRYWRTGLHFLALLRSMSRVQRGFCCRLVQQWLQPLNAQIHIKNSSKHNQLFLHCWHFGLYQWQSSDEGLW